MLLILTKMNLVNISCPLTRLSADPSSCDPDHGVLGRIEILIDGGACLLGLVRAGAPVFSLVIGSLFLDPKDLGDLAELVDFGIQV